MKRIISFVLLLSALAFSQSTLLCVTPRVTESGRDYFLLFDKNPETYYTVQTDTAYRVIFYNTSAGAYCADRLLTLSDSVRFRQELSPVSVFTLSFLLPKDYTAKTLPCQASYAITLRKPNYQKLWERRFPGAGKNTPIAPEKMSLYRGIKYENLFLTFPPSTQNVLVRVEKGRVCVEQFGTGLPLSQDKYEPESKFVEEIAYATCLTDSAASEGVTLLDFAINRKTAVTYTFIPNGLKIRFSKG